MTQPGEPFCHFSKRVQTSMLVIQKTADGSSLLLFGMTKESSTWRAIPKVYGYWNTIYRRFGRWCDIGVFQALHEHFHDAGEICAILLDSTMVRSHSCAAGAPQKNGGQDAQALGRSRADFQRN